jgi:hypothetical protein
MRAMVSARASLSAPGLVDMLSDELVLCAAARAETGVPVRIDRVRVGVPLTVAFAFGVGFGFGPPDDIEVGVDARGLEDVDTGVDAWLFSGDDVEARPDADELGFLVEADMAGLNAA